MSLSDLKKDSRVPDRGPQATKETCITSSLSTTYCMWAHLLMHTPLVLEGAIITVTDKFST